MATRYLTHLSMVFSLLVLLFGLSLFALQDEVSLASLQHYLKLPYFLVGSASSSSSNKRGQRNGADVATLSFRLPVCRKGTVIVTDAAYGVGREVALQLAQEGLHVLACVKNDAELRSFIYDKRKGLEPIVADVSNPPELAHLLYRTRQVALELERPLYGLLINTASALSDLGYDYKLHEQQQLQQQQQQQQGHMVDVDALDTSYKHLLKAPARLVQAAMTMWGGEESNGKSRTRTCAPKKKKKAVARIENDERTEVVEDEEDTCDDEAANACATGATGRIVLLTSSSLEHQRACGSVCVVHDALVSFVHQQHGALNRSIASSVIYLHDVHTEPQRTKGVRKAAAASQQKKVFGVEEDGFSKKSSKDKESDDKESIVLEVLQHFLSSSPSSSSST